MKVEHVKSPTGAEYIHVKEIPEDILFYARREVARSIPLMMGDNIAAAGTDASGAGVSKRKGKAVFLTSIYRESSGQELFSDSHHLVQAVVTKVLDDLDFMPYSPMMQVHALQNAGHILLSVYESGDYYKAHPDLAMLTGLFWLSDDTEFSGGELLFPQFGETIEPKMGTGIIFPSFYLHEVLQVETKPDFHTRFTITCFCGA